MKSLSATGSHGRKRAPRTIRIDRLPLGERLDKEPPRGLLDEVALERGHAFELRRERERVAGVEWGTKGRVGGVQLEQLRDDAPGGVPVEVGVDIGEEFVVGAVRSSVQ